MLFNSKPTPCPICQQLDCVSEMCASHKPLDFNVEDAPIDHYMLGDESISQLDSAEAIRFFQEDK